MRPVLVDTSVLLDIATADPTWGEWSRTAVADVLDRAVAVINVVVYAELAAGVDEVETLDAALPRDLYRREPIPFAAAFLAGQAHREYLGRGGSRRTPLPDFFIGAHAAVAGYRLLTRDPSRIRLSFPRLDLIAPD
jgi:predicted nucleic acid-binding protein